MTLSSLVRLEIFCPIQTDHTVPQPKNGTIRSARVSAFSFLAGFCTCSEHRQASDSLYEIFLSTNWPRKENAAAEDDSRNLFLLLDLNGRGERIRTSDLTVPNRALYQAEPRPDIDDLDDNTSC